MLRATAAASALLLLAAPAGAACPDAYTAIRQELYRDYDEDVTCEQVIAGARALPLRTHGTAHDTVRFAGELDLRRELADAHGVRIPNEFLVLGAVTRQPPAGPRLLLVFALDMPRRIEALRRLLRYRDPPERAELAAVLGDGVWYDRVGMFFEGTDGKLPVDGAWKPMRGGGLWRRHHPIPRRGVRLCRNCDGWLCPDDPVVCFSDLNADGAEEIHLTDGCAEGRCGYAVLEPYANGEVRTILNQFIGRARWRETAEGWVLLRGPECRPGRWRCGSGNPNCRRPELFVVRRDGGAAVRSPKAESRFFPLRRRPWPAGCAAKAGDAELVYDIDGGFTLYER